MTEAETGNTSELWRWLIPLGVLAAAIGYYASYALNGFNVADEGNYAQIAYELFMGRSPNDIELGYGLLWFQLGQWAFELFGPSVTVVKVILYSALTLTVLLVYLTATKLTGSFVLGLIASGVVLVAPPFPPTAFYGVLVMANTYALLQWMERPSSVRGLSAGVVLAVTFLIRPDFGFVFAAVALVIMFSGRATGSGVVLGFSGSLLIALIAALLGGYSETLLEPFLRYPQLMWDLSLAGILPDPAAAQQVIRPPWVDLLGFERVNATLAWLTYGAPLLLLLGLVVVLFEAMREFDDDAIAASDAGQLALGWVAAAAAFPHFFLFRPDLSHLANMMPGFAVLLVVMIERLISGHLRTRLSRVGGLLGATAASLYLAAYGWIGMTQPGTGSMAGLSDGMVPLRSNAGISVRVPAADHDWMRQVVTLVDQHSGPGDQIVCVPYCPGVAFLTGRRMAWDRFYVDSSVQTADPLWLVRVTSQLATNAPAVIVVFDWAVHGTEASKFANWAESYLQAVESLAAEKTQIGGITIYLV